MQSNALQSIARQAELYIEARMGILVKGDSRLRINHREILVVEVSSMKRQEHPHYSQNHQVWADLTAVVVLLCAYMTRRLRQRSSLSQVCTPASRT